MNLRPQSEPESSTEADDQTTVNRWAEENIANWTDDHMVAWWGTWHAEWSGLVQHVTDLLVEQLGIVPGLRILDLASGSGEPAITLARLVGPEGHVTATDVSPGLLTHAAANAQAAGATNLSIQAAPAEDLPFPDHAFERMTCRFGVMYFPDVPRALSEVQRVLVPGGRAGFLVWGPFEEHAFAVHIDLLSRYFPSPEQEEGAPDVTRFSDGASLGEALRAAGFEDVAVAQHSVLFTWPSTLEAFDAYLIDQFQPALDVLTPEEQQAFVSELRQLNRSIARDGRIEGSGPVIAVTGSAK